MSFLRSSKVPVVNSLHPCPSLFSCLWPSEVTLVYTALSALPARSMLAVPRGALAGECQTAGGSGASLLFAGFLVCLWLLWASPQQPFPSPKPPSVLQQQPVQFLAFPPLVKPDSLTSLPHTITSQSALPLGRSDCQLHEAPFRCF
jgi:hypothetical protein